MFVAYGGYHAKQLRYGPVPPPLLVPALALGLAPGPLIRLIQNPQKSKGTKNTSSDAIWMFPQIGVPNNHGFPTKNDHFGVFWGYHHFRKHPFVQGIIFSTI